MKFEITRHFWRDKDNKEWKDVSSLSRMLHPPGRHPSNNSSTRLDAVHLPAKLTDRCSLSEFALNTHPWPLSVDSKMLGLQSSGLSIFLHLIRLIIISSFGLAENRKVTKDGAGQFNLKNKILIESFRTQKMSCGAHSGLSIGSS